MEKKILFRAIIEVLGKPEGHVKETLHAYVESFQQHPRYQVMRADFSELKKQEKEELWAAFAELEAWTEKMEDLTFFCLDYMPSLIEVIEPEELVLSDAQLSRFLNDLQAKLHQVDMLAKQVKMENDILRRNLGALLGNYITILLSNQNLVSEQLSKLTGMDKDKLEDFLDQLIDQGKVDLKEGIYFLPPKKQRLDVDG